jgi:hypothetical protein
MSGATEAFLRGGRGAQSRGGRAEHQANGQFRS